MNKRRFVFALAFGLVAAAVVWGVMPKGMGQRTAVASEAAMRVFHRALPGASLEGVEEDQGYRSPAEYGTPLFWTFKYRQKGDQGDASITPDGLVLRLKHTIAESALPALVAKGLAREARGAKVAGIERQITGATLVYVPVSVPLANYRIVAEQGGKLFLLTVGSQGNAGAPQEMGGLAAGGDDESGGSGASVQATAKEIEVPKEQQEAVRCVKAAYPGAAVVAVEEVGYDDGAGEMSVLYYEVEFPWKGRIKEAHATPDGHLLHHERPVRPDELPQAIRRAVEAKLPKAAIKSATALEDRARMKFVALKAPKTTYVIGLTQQGKHTTLRLAGDGTRIKVFDPATWTRH